MDDKNKIEELESQISELKGIVRDLMDEKDEDSKSEPVIPEWVQDIQKNVDLALHGEEGETIEEHIGDVWLSRLAVLLIMTAIVIGAGITFGSENLGSSVKLAIGYGLSLAAFLFGILARNERNIFQETSVGAGLAGIYFCTYALFFVPGMQMLPGHNAAIPILMISIFAIAAVANIRRSQTAAVIALLAIYYTVVVSFRDLNAGHNLIYILPACLIVTVLTLLFLSVHRWKTFAWIAVASTYATYVFYIRIKSPELVINDVDYFWLSNALLASCYIIFSFACVFGGRGRSCLSRSILLLTLLNTLTFLVIAIPVLEILAFKEKCVFYGGFTFLMGILALTSTLLKPKASRLCQLFTAKCVIALAFTLQLVLPFEWMIVSLSLLVMGLGVFYGMTRMMMFKALNVMLLVVVFIASMFSVRLPGSISVASIAFPASWFCSIGAVTVLLATAWYYERLLKLSEIDEEVKDGKARASASIFNIDSSTLAVLHSSLAALILLTISIMQLGDNIQLPYILAVESVCIAAIGFVLCTPQIELASVLLLVASHVCYHAFHFLWRNEEFNSQDTYVTYSALLAAFTYFGAYLWEKYLRRIETGKEWEHHLVAGIPYVAATLMLAALIGNEMPPLYVPLVQNILGLVLLVYGCLGGFTCVKISGITALATGAVSLFSGITILGEPVIGHPWFIFCFIAVLGTYSLAERILTMLKSPGIELSRIDDSFRKILIITSCVLGLYGLYHWADDGYLTFCWLAFGLFGLLWGVLFRQPWYRWAGLMVLAVTVVRAFFRDLMRLSPTNQFLVFAALGAVLLVTSSLYSRYKRKMHEGKDEGSDHTGNVT